MTVAGVQEHTATDLRIKIKNNDMAEDCLTMDTTVLQSKFYSKTCVDEDCMNHMAKHVGTALRELQIPLSLGEMLKNDSSQELQNYSQIAVVSNGHC